MTADTQNTVGSFRTLVDNLDFAECPRWREDKLWFPVNGQVVSCSMAGETTVMAKAPAGASGLGWLPDGRLLMVSVRDRRLLRLELDGSVVEHADLSDLTPWPINDMVVDTEGRAYVGGFGLDYFSNAPVVPTKLYRVDPDGSVYVSPYDVTFPNGMVLTEGGSVLVVSESLSNRLAAYDVAADGSLSNPRVWASFGPPNSPASVSAALHSSDVSPDGICLDAEGAIWVTDPMRSRVVRVEEGGKILDELTAPLPMFACELGGPEGNTLFTCAAPFILPPFEDSADDPGYAATGQAKILMAEVAVPRPSD